MKQEKLDKKEELLKEIIVEQQQKIESLRQDVLIWRKIAEENLYDRM